LCHAIHRRGSIVVDLSSVTFLDSSAIGMMVRVHDYAKTWRESVTWRGARPDQLRVLEICGVDRVLTLTTTVSEPGA
jgi:anti-anti-sigma factor